MVGHQSDWRDCGEHQSDSYDRICSCIVRSPGGKGAMDTLDEEYPLDPNANPHALVLHSTQHEKQHEVSAVTTSVLEAASAGQVSADAANFVRAFQQGTIAGVFPKGMWEMASRLSPEDRSSMLRVGGEYQQRVEWMSELLKHILVLKHHDFPHHGWSRAGDKRNLFLAEYASMPDYDGKKSAAKIMSMARMLSFMVDDDEVSRWDGSKAGWKERNHSGAPPECYNTSDVYLLCCLYVLVVCSVSWVCRTRGKSSVCSMMASAMVSITSLPSWKLIRTTPPP